MKSERMTVMQCEKLVLLNSLVNRTPYKKCHCKYAPYLMRISSCAVVVDFFIMDKAKRTTNRAQFEKMVDLMKQYPDIARNLTKSGPDVIQEFWQKLSQELNSLGPPIKETAEWKKVWSDHKSSLRKKLAHNKQELAGTGGGPNKIVVFTALEEEVIRLVCLRDCVDGVTNAKKFGVPRKRTLNEANNENLQIETSISNIDEMIASPSFELSDDNHEVETPTEIERQAEVPQSKGPKSLKLLEKQVDIQQTFFENIKEFIKIQNERYQELNTNQKKIYRAIDRLSDRQRNTNEILQQQLEENKRHNARIEHLALEKNKMKQKILEIELHKAELEL